MRKRIAAWCGAFVLMLATVAGAAVTSLLPPSIQWGTPAQVTTPQPQQIVGYDTGTGLPCIMGSTATCSMGGITTGTAGAPSSQVLSVQGVTNGTPLPVAPQAQSSGGASFLNVVAGTTTTTAKSGAGTLLGLNINVKGASSNTLTCYDNTAASGTIIGLFDTTANVASITFGPFGLAFSTGLTCISATGTGANYTLVFK